MTDPIRDAAQALLGAMVAVYENGRRHDDLVAEWLAVMALRDALAAPAPSPDERVEFEAWASDQGLSVKRLDQGDGSSYLDLRTQGPWDAWQASASALLGAAQEDAGHAAMYRWLASRPRRSIMKDDLRYLMSFGYWCTRGELDAAIRAAMKESK